MTNLRKWATVAIDNSTVLGGASTINWAEGQPANSVNNSAREMMAQVRTVYTPDNWGWVEFSGTVSVASQTTFKITGNQTTDYSANRRIRLSGGSTTRYGSIVSASFTAETTVTITVDSGSLSASMTLVAVSSIVQDHVPGNTFITSASLSTLLATKQDDILFQDEGVSLSSAGSVSTVNFVGTAISATVSAGVMTVTVASTSNITAGTAQDTISGTAIDFTGIPASAQRVTIMFNGVSTSGIDNLLIQIGDSGGIEASNYLGAVSRLLGGASTEAAFGTGFVINGAVASFPYRGIVTLQRQKESTFTWVASGILSETSANSVFILAGVKSLSAALDRVRITTINGTDTFDAGSINISYEQ